MEPTGDCRPCATVVEEEEEDDAAAAEFVAPCDDVEEGVCPSVADDESDDSLLFPSPLLIVNHQSFTSEKPEKRKNSNF